jgi:hypothetical protein
MKRTMYIWLLALVIVPFINAGCQNDAKNTTSTAAFVDAGGVSVAESLLHFADLMGFKYMETLEKSKQGDRKAIQQFMDFHGTADGVDGLNHAVASLELIPVTGDENMAYSLKYAKPKLKKLLIERLTLAQGRTTKENLREPLAKMFPMTWAALNDQPIPGACDMNNEQPMAKPGQAAPAATETPAASPQLSPGGGARGKQ